MKIRSNVTSEAVISEAKSLNAVFKKISKSYRRGLYDLMGEAARIVQTIETKDKLKKRFRAKIEKLRETKGPETFKVSLEVMALVMGAKSRTQRQLASKRGRVLDILLAGGVTPKRIAEMIVKGGGIERILSKDSRKQALASSTDLLAGSRISREEQQAQRIFRQADENERHQQSRRNDVDVIVPIYMRISDRDSILESRVGSRIKISAIRIGQRKADVKVTEVELSQASDIPRKDNNDEW